MKLPPALLALGMITASLLGSGCLTSGAIRDAATQEPRAPALRVRHCYLSPKHQLLVLAEGGAWQRDQLATPKEPISFALELTQLAKQLILVNQSLGYPSDQLTAYPAKLPQTIMKAGWPNEEFLRQNGYKEIMFAEVNQSDLVRTRKEDRSATVLVIYEKSANTQYFPPPDYLGFSPHFIVQNLPDFTSLGFNIADTRTTLHPNSLLLIPITLPLDLILAPVENKPSPFH
ncbi:MAG: hypothetical protein WCL04_07075 [Verrucomicrobiota bacterium]